MQKITDRQRQVLDLIKTYIDQTGMPPTRADIAGELGFRSANAAEDHLKALAKKGVIEIVPGASRGIRLNETSGIPIVGKVAAGCPILAQEHIDEYCNLPSTFFKPSVDFFLVVTGDSMIDAGINNGDLLAVHSTCEVQNGDIVVARIEDEVTVKRFKKGDNEYNVELHPENSDYQPILIDLRNISLHIEGQSVGIIRRTMH